MAPAMIGDLRIGLLGSLEAFHGDRRVDIAGAKQRLLVAFLASAVGIEVSADRLTDELWGDDVPMDAANALHRQVSRLRKTLGEGIVRRPNGYLLDIDEDGVDSKRFERLAAEGRAALRNDDAVSAASTLRAALALWRGDPFVEFANKGWAGIEASRLDQVRQGAVEDRFDADLAMGLHVDVVSEIEASLKEHPFSERLWAQLMLALYRCERQADALDAYLQAKTLLAEEHGLDPGPELQRLQAAILAQDPSLAARGKPDDGIAVASAGPPEPPSNLPTPLTSFVGRHDQLSEIRAILHDRRLVTLTGPPGVGKTRLAIEIGRAERAYPDGVWLIPLAPLADPEDIDDVVAAVLGAREPQRTEPASSSEPPDPTLGRLVAHLRSRRTLLILDNCEHLLVGVAGLVEQLLGGCSNLTILATSREGLAVPGEMQWVVPPLSLPNPGLSEPRELAASEAVRLFEDRAVQVRPAFQVTAETAAAIAEICRRLDGIPLAIELAAARVKVLPVTHIAEALEDRFRLLTSGSRTASPRQQTLRATVDWSYDLLHADERTVFESLSVFTGGFPLAAVPWVEARMELGRYEVVHILGSLVDKSLLVLRPNSTREPRYDMLETLRAYGQEKLTDGDRITSARRLHAEYFAEMAGTTEWQLYGPEHREALMRLDGELENLRAAIQFALADGDHELALRIAGALGWFFGMTERQSEGRSWLESALSGADAVSAGVRAQAFSYLGFLAGQQRDFGRAVEAGERGLELAVASGDPWQTSLAKTALAGTLRDAGRLERVASLLAEARAGFETFTEPRGDWGVAGCEMIAVREAIRLDDLDAVERSSRELMTRAHRIGYLPWEAMSSLFASWVEERRGDLGAATDACEAALEIARRLGLSPFASLVLALRGRLALRRGDLDSARAFLSEAVGRVDPVVAPWFAAVAHHGLAVTLQRSGDIDGSEALHRRVVAESPAIGSTAAHRLDAHAFGDPAARSLTALGTLALLRDDVKDAERLQFEGLERAERERDDEAIALGLEGLAAAANPAGDPERAATLLGAADSVRDAARVQRDPTEAKEAGSTGANARSVLGARAFEDAVTRGRALTRDAALATARLA